MTKSKCFRRSCAAQAMVRSGSPALGFISQSCAHKPRRIDFWDSSLVRPNTAFLCCTNSKYFNNCIESYVSYGVITSFNVNAFYNFIMMMMIATAQCITKSILQIQTKITANLSLFFLLQAKLKFKKKQKNCLVVIKEREV